ncbi:glycosyl hydrolase family 95 catalytic domain-containing protein [Actinomadura rudentiformis]|uniref:Tat pathway signal sequence domain protein n=1 Tax=Actinomadura rudentiformis TaxID=359158 RepID=A0A6H9Z5Q4_9ACTN|nr:Tat pathway signal sequence domain protein [Actinomadura rudentiformis]KAB2352638.1 Tat pathway signal sequence domain protein [Actinomadura rudentiformis]
MTESPLSRRALLGATAAGAASATLIGGTATAAAADGLVDVDVDWPRFLADADLIWKRLPQTWYEGPFLGNALLGSGIYAEPGANAIRFNVQHSQVQDHRPQFGSLFGLARLPIGYLTLEPVGAITGIDWRLDLWNAELRGTVTTAAGSLTLRAIVHDDRSVLAVEVNPSEGERGFRWVFHPAKAISPRADPVFNKPPPEGYTANPEPSVARHGDLEVIVQPLLAGGQHVTAWQETRRGRRRTLYAAVAWSFPETTAEREAVRMVRGAARRSFTALTPGHRAWWHAYYRKSFLSLPDRRAQAFYWIQLYKIASAARRDAPVMATSGPWLEPTPWPAVWWNLNVQLEYCMIHGSNHLELDAVTRSLDRYRRNLVDQVDQRYRADSAGIPRTTDMTLLNSGGTGTSGFPVGIPGQASPTPEVGNLTWALHNVWLSYRHTMDLTILRDVLYPLLRRAVNYYRHFLAPGADGRLHLPFTFSPEYGVNAPDCNYDLALIRWGCQTLLETVEALGARDPLVPEWRKILATLADYPVDGNGYMIGAGVPFAKSHRHYSHLLMIYPLYEVTWEQPDKRALIDRSLKHWISFEGALQGYSFTGAASISAQMQRGDDAAFYLSELLRRFVQPNTMYKESGPVIETPLSAAQSMHDMVCQSWGEVIRVFPALPASWPDLAVHDFRTQGAFLLSAVRRSGRTEFVRLKSLAGAPCRLRPGIPGPLKVRSASGRRVPWRVLPNGDIEIGMRRGEEVIVHNARHRPDLQVGPAAPGSPAPPWGLPA